MPAEGVVSTTPEASEPAGTLPVATAPRARSSMEAVLILGIDPGSRHTGWGLLRWRGDEQLLVADGRLSTPLDVELPLRLAALSRGVADLVDRFGPDAAAVETSYYGMNPRSLIVLAQARGAILAALAGCGLEVLEYSPAEVKTAIAGNGRAHKSEVARMVSRLLRLGERARTADTTDAIALALCCARRYRMDRARRRS